METLKFSDLKYEEKDLHIPSLQEVKEGIQIVLILMHFNIVPI